MKKIIILISFITTILTLSLTSNAVSYKYDNLNRLTEVTYDSGQKITYTYDAGGNMLSSTTSSGSINMISNPSFDVDEGWSYYNDNTAKVVCSRDTVVYDSAPAGLKIQCTSSGSIAASIQVYTKVPMTIQKDKVYNLTFRAKASSSFDIPWITLMKNNSPWTNYSVSKMGLPVTSAWHNYSMNFKANADAADMRLIFALGNALPNGSLLYLDSFSLSEVEAETPAQLLNNPSFDTDATGWACNSNSATQGQAAGSRTTAVYDSAPAGYNVHCTAKGNSAGSIQLTSTGTGYSLKKDKVYNLTFRAKATSGFSIPSIDLCKNVSPWTNYSKTVSGLAVTSSWQSYSINFKANETVSDAQVLMSLGNSLPDGADFYIDTLSLTEIAEVTSIPGRELLSNPSFDVDAGWGYYIDNTTKASCLRDTAVYDSAPAGLKIQCTSSGAIASSFQVYTKVPMSIEKGKVYNLTFKAKASSNFNIPWVALMKNASPWTNYSVSKQELPVTTEWQSYSVDFKANTDADDMRLLFALGGVMPEGSVLYMDTFSLKEVETVNN